MPVAGLVNKQQPRRYRFGGYVQRRQGGGPTGPGGGAVSVGDTTVIDPGFGSHRLPPQEGPTWSPYSPTFYGAPGLGNAGGDFGMPAAGPPPPELAGYFNDWTSGYSPRIDDPRKVAAESGVTLGQLAGGFFPRNEVGDKDFMWPGQGYEYPSDKGGFFTLRDLYGQTGTPAMVPTRGPQRPGGAGANLQFERVGQQNIPAIGTWGADAPSTNNWRLLGRGPNAIMRNGFIIRPADVGTFQGLAAGQTAHGGNTGEQAVQGLGRVALGTGAAYGLPNLYANSGWPASAGWPGAEGWIPVFPGNV